MNLDNAPAPKAGGMSGWNKLLIGCGLGCGVLMIGMIGAGGFATMWLFKPGEQVATERIIGEESIGAARSGELADDPGTQELLTHVVRRIDEIDRAAQEAMLPESLDWLNAFHQEPNAKDFNMMIPRDVTVTLERVADQEDPAILVALNFRAFVRPIAALFAWAGKNEEGAVHWTHQGFEIYELGEDEGLISWVDSTLLFSNSAEAIERALNRVTNNYATVEEASRPPSAEVEIGDGWDLTGRLRNEDGILVDFLRSETGVEPPPSGDDLEAQFGLDIATGNVARARLRLLAADTAEAASWMPFIEARLEEMRARAVEEGFEAEVDARVEGSDLWVDVELTGLEAVASNGLRPDAGPGWEELIEDAIESELSEDAEESTIDDGSATGGSATGGSATGAAEGASSEGVAVGAAEDVVPENG